jgi:hypothetical protein
MKIRKIEEVNEDNESGFIVFTKKEAMRFLIDNRQDCCETWGYLWTNDTPQDFIGAEILGISLTNEALQTEKYLPPNDYETAIIFVNINTDRGVLQFVAYNCHNGYYGHTVSISSSKLKYSTTL